jgi:hypothetical protein
VGPSIENSAGEPADRPRSPVVPGFRALVSIWSWVNGHGSHVGAGGTVGFQRSKKASCSLLRTRVRAVFFYLGNLTVAGGERQAQTPSSGSGLFMESSD